MKSAPTLIERKRGLPMNVPMEGLRIRPLVSGTIGDYCYLQDLVVAEETRGRGAARALIAVVAEASRAAGAARLYWLTHESNTGARALYDQVAARSGFIQYKM